MKTQSIRTKTEDLEAGKLKSDRNPKLSVRSGAPTVKSRMAASTSKEEKKTEIVSEEMSTTSMFEGATLERDHSFLHNLFNNLVSFWKSMFNSNYRNRRRYQWDNDRVFLNVAVSLTFNISNVLLFPLFCLTHGVGCFVTAYLIAMITFAIPFLYLESFLGTYHRCSQMVIIKRICPIFSGLYWLLGYNTLLTTINNFFIMARFTTNFYSREILDNPIFYGKAGEDKKFHLNDFKNIRQIFFLHGVVAYCIWAVTFLLIFFIALGKRVRARIFEVLHDFIFISLASIVVFLFYSNSKMIDSIFDDKNAGLSLLYVWKDACIYSLKTLNLGTGVHTTASSFYKKSETAKTVVNSLVTNVGIRLFVLAVFRTAARTEDIRIFKMTSLFTLSGTTLFNALTHISPSMFLVYLFVAAVVLLALISLYGLVLNPTTFFCEYFGIGTNTKLFDMVFIGFAFLFGGLSVVAAAFKEMEVIINSLDITIPLAVGGQAILFFHIYGVPNLMQDYSSIRGSGYTLAYNIVSNVAGSFSLIASNITVALLIYSFGTGFELALIVFNLLFVFICIVIGGGFVYLRLIHQQSVENKKVDMRVMFMHQKQLRSWKRISETLKVQHKQKYEKMLEILPDEEYFDTNKLLANLYDKNEDDEYNKAVMAKNVKKKLKKWKVTKLDLHKKPTTKHGKKKKKHSVRNELPANPEDNFKDDTKKTTKKKLASYKLEKKPSAVSGRNTSKRGPSKRGESKRGESNRGESRRGESNRGESKRGPSKRKTKTDESKTNSKNNNDKKSEDGSDIVESTQKSRVDL